MIKTLKHGFIIVLLSTICLAFVPTRIFAAIKVGTLLFNPPYVYSHMQGFEIDLIKSICKNLKEKCELFPMEFNQLFESINSGKIDVAIGNIIITEDRKKEFVFSAPYLMSEGSFLTLKNHSQSIADFNGKKIGIISTGRLGAVFSQYLITNYKDRFEVIPLNDIEDVLTELTHKRIAGAFIHNPIAFYWKENGGGLFEVVGGADVVGEGLGIMALPKNQPLIQKMNQALQALKDNGTYLNIYKKYINHKDVPNLEEN